MLHKENLHCNIIALETTNNRLFNNFAQSSKKVKSILMILLFLFFAADVYAFCDYRFDPNCPCLHLYQSTYCGAKNYYEFVGPVLCYRHTDYFSGGTCEWESWCTAGWWWDPATVTWDIRDGSDHDHDGHPGPGGCLPADDCNDNDASIYPGAPELCDGKDNNCNNSTDEGFNIGTACSAGIGACERGGQMVCSSDMASTVCSATPGVPSAEVCDNIDNDCNGATDDFPPQSCYTGPLLTSGIGLCKDGTQTCTNGQWGDCEGEVVPVDEICGDNKDNDCNNMTDDGCQCKDTVQISSTVNMATGNLSHEQPLYITMKAVLPLDLELIYNSLDGDGILGKGWTHSYNMSVTQSNDGVYIYTGASSKKIALYLSGAQYKPLDFEYPVLIVNPDGTYTLRQDENTVYSFNSSGKVTAIQDRFSNTITFTYTADRLTGIADAQGRVISLAYNAGGRIETITDPNANIHSLVYEGNNLVNISTLTTDLQSLTWAYTYTPQGQMQTKTTPMGYTITYA